MGAKNTPQDVIRLPETRCLECGHTLNAVGTLDGTRPAPRPGAPGLRGTLRRLDIPDREGPFRDVYRALPYVRREIESLAEQLRAIAAAA